MRLSSACLLACSVLGIAASVTAADSHRLIVHEWGTFTALLNENGKQLLGINVDTEPVPGFVHNLGRFILNDAVLSSHHWVHRQKAVPRNHPQVSLRLETPVIYFYPPAGAQLPLRVDVDVKFRGGWVTEFYPQADVSFPTVHNGEFQFTDLTPQSMGHITWKNVLVGTNSPGPETSDHVWLAPRQVAAAGISTAHDEHEKYLFYRGVAHQRAPLRVITKDEGRSLSLQTDFREVPPADHRSMIQHVWLMQTRKNGLTAYRRLEPLPVVHGNQAAPEIMVRRRFSDSEFSDENRGRLEKEMFAAITQEGLFDDEAKALLSTWQQAYFVSPGLRVFYTVPRAWTDYYLPLKISSEPDITRVMIGRVELISDEQRALLDQLAQMQPSNGEWLDQIPFESPALKRLLSGRIEKEDLGIEIPADFQIYLDLGRFRNALVAAEQKRLRSENLAQFIKINHLDPFLLSQKSGK